jgi:hypothetical protein
MRSNPVIHMRPFYIGQLFRSGQNGLLYLPTPHLSYPQYVEHTGQTAASADTVTGFVTDRSQSGFGNLGPQLLENSDFEIPHPTQTAWNFNLSPSTIEDGFGKATGDASNVGLLTQDVSNTANRFYINRFNIDFIDGSARMVLRDQENNVALHAPDFASSGDHQIIFYQPGNLTRVVPRTSNNDEEVWYSHVYLNLLPGHHAHQATSANRPLLKNEDGLWYWLFDGSNDFLTVPGLVLSQPFTAIFAVRVASSASGLMYVFSGIAGSRTTELSWWSGDDKFRIHAGGAARAADDICLAGNDYLVTAVFDASNSRIRINSGEWTELSSPGTAGVNGLYLGTRYDATTSFWNGLIYGGLIRSGILTDDEIVASENFLANKAGISL